MDTLRTVKWCATLVAVAVCLQVQAEQSAEPPAAPRTEVTFGPGSRLSLEGSSTLHRYKSEAKELHAFLATGPALEGGSPLTLEALAREGALRSFEFTLPVEKLSSGEGALDRRMFAALDSVHYPDITFKMDSYRPSAGADPQSLLLKIGGLLSIAGTSRRVSWEVHAFPGPEAVRLIASKVILMSDYGVKPPTFMGVMKTDDHVTVRFDLMARAVRGKDAAPTRGVLSGSQSTR